MLHDDLYGSLRDEGLFDSTGQFTITPQNPGQFDGGLVLGGGGATETITFDVSDAVGAMTPGNMTIEADLEVKDVNSQLPLLADNFGSLLVQTPADLAILAVLPDLDTVTRGMDRDFVIRVPVRNDGQSEVNLDLSAPATQLLFPPATDWVFAVRPELAMLEKGLSFDKVIVDLFQGENKKPPFSELAPRGQVPTLVYGAGSDAIIVYESIAIIRFIDDMHPEPPLMPSAQDPRRRAQALMRIEEFQAKLDP